MEAENEYCMNENALMVVVLAVELVRMIVFVYQDG